MRIIRPSALLWALLLFLQPAAAPAADTMLDWLKIGAGGRAVALGDAVVSNVDDPSATYWNPGALALTAGTQAELTHNEMLQGVRYEFASLSHRLGSRHGVGLAFHGVWTDQLRSYDERGDFVGTFGFYGVALVGGYGFALTDRIGIGAGLEYLREAMDEFSTSGTAFNFGIQAREILPRTDAGLAVIHLGSSMQYETRSYDLPATVQGGVSHRLPLGVSQGSLRVSAEFRQVRSEDAQMLFGTEYSYQDLARLRVGYLTRHDTQDVSFGLGVGSGQVQGQYAYVPLDENLGDQHRLSLLLSW